jgi:hypothetical protein
LGKLHSAYVRASSKKTGKVIDENGVVAEHNEDADNADMANSAADATASNTKDNSKTYTPKKQYRPTGKLIYNQDIFENREENVVGCLCLCLSPIYE